MRNFQYVSDLGDLRAALDEARAVKADRYRYEHLGRHRTALLIFFNNSLRTRLSTQKAARNLGMDVIVLDVNQGAWKLETERGVVMDGDKSEHLLEAVPVMAQYCDLIGVRTFARFENREDDYTERILNQFIQHSGRPVFSMESATVHPLQAFADLITIDEYKEKPRPKVVLTWAPHPRSLPQAVPNSFAEWMNASDVDFVVTHPEGYELDPRFVGNARVEYDQWNEERIGVRTSLSRRIFDDFTQVTVGYKFEHVNVNHLGHHLKYYIKSNNLDGGSYVSQPSILIGRDTRDSLTDPTSGYNINFFGSLTPKVLEANFARDAFLKVGRLFVEDPEATSPKAERDTLSEEFDPLDVWPGHSYFITKEMPIQQRWRYEIRPLLMEYVRDGVLKPKALEKIRDMDTEFAL